MVIVSCPVDDCPFKTEDVDVTVVVVLLNIHSLKHQTAVSNEKIRITGPKLERPHIDIGVDTETWNSFISRWDTFQHYSGIDETSAPAQLFQCATVALGDVILKSSPDITRQSLEDVMELMKWSP